MNLGTCSICIFLFTRFFQEGQNAGRTSWIEKCKSHNIQKENIEFFNALTNILMKPRKYPLIGKNLS